MKYKIIDTHAHIFPDKIASIASAKIGAFYTLPMLHSGSVAELLALCAENNIEKTIVSSCATKVEQVSSINKFICASAQNPKLVGLIALHPDLSTAELDRQIAYALDNNLKGVKLHPDFQQFNIDSKKAQSLYAALEGVLPILFHVGDEQRDYSHPRRLIKVLKRYPKLQAIAAHLGGYTKWDEAACYAEVRNCYYDCSSALCFMDRDKGAKLIEFLGVDKVMFGSDYPMSNAAKEIEILLSLGLDNVSLEKIFYTNANRFYGGLL